MNEDALGDHEEDSFGRLAEWYSKQTAGPTVATAATGALALTPAAPLAALLPGVDRFLAAYGTGRWQKRVEEMFNRVDKRLDEMGVRKLDAEFLKSEEFECLVTRILLDLRLQHEQEKLTLFAEILAGSLAKPDLSADQRTRYLAFIEDLTGTHLAVLRLLTNRYLEVKSSEKDQNEIEQRRRGALTTEEIADALQLTVSDADGYIADLEARGLVFDPFVGTYGYMSGQRRSAIHPGGYAFGVFLLRTEVERRGVKAANRT